MATIFDGQEWFFVLSTVDVLFSGDRVERNSRRFEVERLATVQEIQSFNAINGTAPSRHFYRLKVFDR